MTVFCLFCLAFFFFVYFLSYIVHSDSRFDMRELSVCCILMVLLFSVQNSVEDYRFVAVASFVCALCAVICTRSIIFPVVAYLFYFVLILLRGYETFPVISVAVYPVSFVVMRLIYFLREHK